MKKLLITLLVLNSLTALAHPSDSDPATAIDVGSILTLQRDLNIPSHNKVLFMDGNEYRAYAHVKKGPFCNVGVYKDENTKLARDARLKDQLKLTVIKVKSNGRFVRILTKAPSNYLVLFSCYKEMVGSNGTIVPSIGEVKQSLSGVVEIELAEPVEI